MEKKNIVLTDKDTNEVVYPATRSSNVICGGLTLNQKLADDGIIIKDSGTNTYKKITLVNGVFQFEDVTVASSEISFLPTYKVLCIGNSLTLHGITSYWWGWWAMAASQRDNAWPNLLRDKLSERLPENEIIVHSVNVADWERNLSLSLQNSHGNSNASDTEGNIVSGFDFSGYDLIIYRAGENVTDTANYETALTSFINQLLALNPNAQYIITGTFWANSTKETIHQNVANAFGYTYVPLSQYGNSTYEESLGNQVYGDDGELHTIENSGVAQHASDLGMAAMANDIFDAIEFDRI